MILTYLIILLVSGQYLFVFNYFDRIRFHSSRVYFLFALFFNYTFKWNGGCHQSIIKLTNHLFNICTQTMIKYQKMSSSHWRSRRSIPISGQQNFPCNGTLIQQLSPWPFIRKQPRICCSISVQDSTVEGNRTINRVQRRRLTSQSLSLCLASQRR